MSPCQSPTTADYITHQPGVAGIPAKLKSACHDTPAANKSEAAPHLGAEAAWGLAGGMPSLEPCGTCEACGAFEAWGACWAWPLGDTAGAGWLGRGLDPKGGLASVRTGASAGLTEASASEGPLLAGRSCRSMRLHPGGKRCHQNDPVRWRDSHMWITDPALSPSALLAVHEGGIVPGPSGAVDLLAEGSSMLNQCGKAGSLERWAGGCGPSLARQQTAEGAVGEGVVVSMCGSRARLCKLQAGAVRGWCWWPVQVLTVGATEPLQAHRILCDQSVSR